MRKVLSIAVLASFFCTGCATVFSDSSYPVTIVSCPPEAQYKIKNQEGDLLFSGVTPSEVTLDSEDGYFSAAKYTVELNKLGFEKTSVEIEGSLDSWYLGGVFFFPPLMLIIDPVTGAMWKLPHYKAASLQANESANTLNKQKTEEINAKHVCSL